MKPKFWLIQRISLPTGGDVHHGQAGGGENSMAKSRSLTASRLFWQTPSIPSVWPRAAVQRVAGAGQRARRRGRRLTRRRTSASRSASRANISTYASRWCQSSPAGPPRWVEAGQDDRTSCFSACSTSTRCSATSSLLNSSISPRSHRRTSVATWSLRLRPVCRRLPAMPTSSVVARPTLRCTSSRSSFHDKAASPDLGG